jgi:hypothetical protein
MEVEYHMQQRMATQLNYGSTLAAVHRLSKRISAMPSPNE